MRAGKLELYELDPAGEIPESELRQLTCENPVGGGTPVVVTVIITLFVFVQEAK